MYVNLCSVIDMTQSPKYFSKCFPFQLNMVFLTIIDSAFQLFKLGGPIIHKVNYLYAEL